MEKKVEECSEAPQKMTTLSIQRTELQKEIRETERAITVKERNINHVTKWLRNAFERERKRKKNRTVNE